MITQKYSSVLRLYDKKKGFTILLSILIISVIATVIAISLVIFGMSARRTSFAQEQSYNAQTYAEACAEEALQKIHESNPFTGMGSLSFSYGTCNYTVTKTGGQSRTIATDATVGTIVRKIAITLDKIKPTIRIISWQNVADF